MVFRFPFLCGVICLALFFTARQPARAQEYDTVRCKRAFLAGLYRTCLTPEQEDLVRVTSLSNGNRSF